MRILFTVLSVAEGAALLLSGLYALYLGIIMVLTKVIISSVSDTPKFAPAKWELELDICCSL